MQSILAGLTTFQIDTLAQNDGLTIIDLHTKNEAKAQQHVLKYMYAVNHYGTTHYYTHYSGYLGMGYGTKCTMKQAKDNTFYLKVEAYEEF